MKIKHKKIRSFLSALGSLTGLLCVVMIPNIDSLTHKLLPLSLILISTGLLFYCMFTIVKSKLCLVSLSKKQAIIPYITSNIKNNKLVIKYSLLILCYISIFGMLWLIKERQIGRAHV